MADRRCPNCGELVPAFSLTCPKCYRSIPREEPEGRYRIIDDDRAPSPRMTNHRLVFILSIIPAVFGLFGLGQLYQRDWAKGLTFLAAGVLLMTVMVLMFGAGGAMGIVLGIGTLILFIGVFLLQAFDSIVRSLFTFQPASPRG